MQGVITVVFVAWLAVALAVYVYRIWRRVTQGSKAAREARGAAGEGRAAALPSDTARPFDTAWPFDAPSGRATPTEAPPPGPSPLGPVSDVAPTVAEALRGIDLPCDLVPIVDPDQVDAASGRRVVFTTRTSTVRTVAASLADALEALAYQVSDVATDPSGERRQLIARRTGFTVSVAVSLDAVGTVAAEIST